MGGGDPAPPLILIPNWYITLNAGDSTTTVPWWLGHGESSCSPSREGGGEGNNRWHSIRHTNSIWEVITGRTHLVALAKLASHVLRQICPPPLDPCPPIINNSSSKTRIGCLLCLPRPKFVLAISP
jgi:hypothetical protein